MMARRSKCSDPCWRLALELIRIRWEARQERWRRMGVPMELNEPDPPPPLIIMQAPSLLPDWQQRAAADIDLGEYELQILTRGYDVARAKSTDENRPR